MANVPCPHCGQPIDVLQLVYANASAREQERVKTQADFDKKREEGSNDRNDTANSSCRAPHRRVD